MHCGGTFFPQRGIVQYADGVRMIGEALAPEDGDHLRCPELAALLTQRSPEAAGEALESRMVTSTM